MFQPHSITSPLAVKKRSIVFLGTAHDNGGSSILAANLAIAMRNSGHHVEEWYLFASSGLTLPAETRVFRHGPRSVTALTSVIPRATAALRAHRPDVVIGLQSLSNLVVGIGGALAGVPQRIATHHNPTHALNRHLMMLDRIAGSLGAYTHIVACAQSVADSYAANGRRYVRRLEIIPNGQKAPLRVASASARSRLDLPAHGSVIGQIGRFCAQKNQSHTVDLLASLPDVTAVFIGDGPDLAAVSQALDARGLMSRARIIPALPPAEIGSFFGACDAVVFPSRFEGLSLAAIEAVHCGTPLLCSDIPSFRELFAPSAALIRHALLPLSDQDAWRGALTRLLNDATHRQAMQSALAALAPSYSFETMAARYLALIEAAAS